VNYRAIGHDGEPWPQWVRDLKSKSGVYVIKNRDDSYKALYVGSSGGKLRDTLQRHFEQWRRKKNFWKGMRGAHHDPGMTYRRSAVCVAVVITPKGAHLDEEARLIHALKPRDNLVLDPSGDVPF
jgi:excinuclease UvrABC nuclease subunit